MFRVDIVGKRKFGARFDTINEVNDWIRICESKPSHPWGRPGGWYKLVGENTIEFMGHQIIKPEEILETREYDGITEVRLAADHTISIVDLDQDAEEIQRVKKRMIIKVREMAKEQIEEKYTAIDIGVINTRAILAVSKGNQPSAAFNNMLDFIGTINNEKGTCIDSIKAAITMVQLRAITYNGKTLI